MILTGRQRPQQAFGPTVRQRAPGANRTRDTRFRRAVLYPLSYEGGGADSHPPTQSLQSGSGNRQAR